MKTLVKGLLLGTALLLVAARPAAAQSGFTALGNIGFGIQHDTDFDDTAYGLGGVNVGAGWFLSPKIAVLGRISGTMVTFNGDPALGTVDVKQSAYVYGGSIQFWLNRWASVEGGIGYGQWRDPDFSDKGHGLGIIAAFHATVWQTGPHHVRVGFEYAPVFDNDNDFTVHNMGIVAGYQYVKK